jgi:dipeptidyl aminopeptidase/acylaminoacyl peptidase
MKIKPWENNMADPTWLRLLSCVFLIFITGEVANAREINLDDLGAISNVSTPRVAPDGKSVAIVVSRPDYESNQFESRLVLVDIASGEARDLTFERPEVSRPRWSPSGERLAFLAQDDTAEDPQQQVFVLPISGGEARVITAAPRGVSSFEWSADGKEIFYVAPDAAEETPEGPERHNQSFVVTHHDYLADQRPPDSHIWRLAIDGGDASRINGDDVVAVGGHAGRAQRHRSRNRNPT